MSLDQNNEKVAAKTATFSTLRAPGMGVNLAVKVRCGLGSGNH